MSLLADLAGAVGPDNMITAHAALRTYETDGLASHRAIPQAVVLPTSTAQVAAAVRACRAAGVPFVARGAGTGLSGGAVPVVGGIVIGLSRMNAILDVDVPNRCVRVQPGVTNLDVTKAVAPHGLYYAPDPSSQQVCTIGGNVAENSGGAHCLKYGFTTNHVLEAEVVLADGEIVRLDPWGSLDLLGAVVGSEGTLGIVTEALVRVLPSPQRVETLLADYASTDAAGEAVSAIIAAGVIPAAIEMMDELSIHAAEHALHVGLPLDAGAILLVELDGPAVEVEATLGRVVEICEEAGARTVRRAENEEQRAGFWRGRKAAFPAMGRLSRDYYVQDGVVPRTRLPETLRRIARALQGARPARRQRFPRRRRQPASAGALRRPGRGRGRAGRGARVADPDRLSRRRRVADGRARRRPRQGAAHAADVHRGRSARHAPPPLRLRPGGPVQPGQAVPDARGCAARCPAPIASTRWSGRG